MAYTKRGEQKSQDILDMLAKRWTPATTFEELEERANRGFTFFDRETKKFLNDIWRTFSKYPETFLFERYIEKIKDIYKMYHVSISSKFDKQADNMLLALDRICAVVRGKLYPKVNVAEKSMGLMQEERVVEFSKGLIKANKVLKNGRMPLKKFTTSLKNLFLEDTTSIDAFNAGCEEYVVHLHKLGVETVGDFMLLLQDKKSFNAYANYNFYHKSQHSAFINNLADYINNSPINNQYYFVPEGQKVEEQKVAEQNGEQAEEQKEEEQVEENKVATDVSLHSGNADSDRKQLFAEYDKLPCEFFIKGSEEMAEVSKKQQAYLKQKIQQGLDAGLTEEDVKEMLLCEGKLFHDYVDKRREEYNTQSRAGRLNKIVDEIVDYKYKQPNRDLHEHGISHKHHPNYEKNL